MPERYWLFQWFHDYMKEVLLVVSGIAAATKIAYDNNSHKAFRKEIKDKNIVAIVENLAEWKEGLDEKGIVTQDMCIPSQRKCQDVIADRLLAGDKLLAERMKNSDELFNLTRQDIAQLHQAVTENTRRQDTVLEILATVQLRHSDKPARELHEDK